MDEKVTLPYFDTHVMLRCWGLNFFHTHPVFCTARLQYSTYGDSKQRLAKIPILLLQLILGFTKGTHALL